jgi:uncharacterized membrane protein
MIKFGKNSWFFYSVICFLFILNLALLVKIPVLLQVLGFAALCLVPGFLLSALFKIKVSPPTNFLYAIGLSIISDLIFGLFLNALIPVFGVNNPLSPQNIQIGFSVMVLILSVIIIVTDRAPEISLKIPKMVKEEKLFLIFGLFIVTSFLVSIYLLNGNTTNLFLISSILLIPVLLLSVLLFHSDSLKRIYPAIIFFISFSLLMIMSLKSNFIIGDDVHQEYYFFYTTFIQSAWITNPSLALSSAISISLLPTLFENFLSVDPQLLFKVLYPFIFSVVPVLIYIIVRRYTDELLAFFAACFFIFQQIFIETSSNCRTSLAIFFFAFSVLVLFDRELSHPKKYVMLSLFILGAVFSHYTSALIFLLIFVSAYLINLALSGYDKQKTSRLVNLPLIIFFIGFIYFWYAQITGVLSFAIKFLGFRIIILHDLFFNDVSKYYYIPSMFIYNSAFQKFLNIYPRFICFVLMGIGILFASYSFIQSEIKRNAHPRFSVPLDRMLLFMGFVAFFLYVCSIFAGFLFFGYDVSRLAELLFVVLAVFLVIGASHFFSLVLYESDTRFSKREFYKKIRPVADYCKSHQNKIVSFLLFLLLVPQLFASTQLINQFSGGPYSLILNSPHVSSNSNDDPGRLYYIFDQDSQSLQWFKENSYYNSTILSDYYGNTKITSLVVRSSTLYQDNILEADKDQLENGYIFLPKLNRDLNSVFAVHAPETQISTFNPVFDQKHKIFENGAAIYR